MTINQLSNKTDLLESDFLLMSDGSIDYKCTVKELISNSLSTFSGLTLGSEGKPAENIFAKNLTISGGEINLLGLPNFGGPMGTSSRPIFIGINEDGKYVPQAVESNVGQVVLACTGDDVKDSNSYSWLKYSSENTEDTLVTRTSSKDIQASTFNGMTLGTPLTENEKDIPSSKSVKTITDGLQGAINTIKGTGEGSFNKGDADTLFSAKTYTDDAVKIKKEDTANTTKRYFVNFEGNIDSKDVSNPKFQSSDKIYVEYKDSDSDGKSEAWFTASYVCNAVWNDIADYLNVDKDLEVIYGRAYTRDPKTNKVRLAQKNEKVIGLASDTCGFQLGKNDKEHQIPIALGGWILAYTDKNYKPGTLLKVGKKGILTKASKLDEIFNPSRIIASFDRVEKEETWHGKVVNGRNWIKIK